jgi:hypothetical protein
VSSTIGDDERHHDRLHHELERDAEDDPEREAADPAPGPHVTDLAPWRMGPMRPQQHENRAEGLDDDVAQDDDDHRQQP